MKKTKKKKIKIDPELESTNKGDLVGANAKTKKPKSTGFQIPIDRQFV